MRICTTTILATAISLTLAACGGGGGGGTASTPPPPLTLTGISPATGSAAGIDIAPTIGLSSAPDMASVNASAISLTSTAGTVETRLAQNGNGISVTPTQALVWGSHYQLSVTDAIRSVAGARLTAGSTFSFDTRMPAWGAVSTISNTGPYIAHLKSSFAANGDTVAVWDDVPDNDGGTQIFASRFISATQNWSVPQRIQGNKNSADSPDISINANGNGAAIWAEQQASGNYAIKVVRFDTVTGWGTPVTLSAPDQNAQYSLPRVATAKNGSIIATWKLYHGNDVKKSTSEVTYFDAASRQWSSARSMQSQSDSTFPLPAIDANGNALLLWADDSITPGVLHSYAARYDAAAKTWGAPTSLRPDNPGITYAMEIAFDAANNAFAILKEDSTIGGRLYVARYNAAATSWGKAEDIQSGDAGTPQIGFDTAGNALLAWTQYANQTYSIQSRRYQQSTNTWTTLPSQNYYVSSFTMPMQVDPAGNAVLAWVGYDNSLYTLNTVRYDAASGKWTAPQILFTRSAAVGDPVLSMDRSGQATLLWPSYTANFFSNRSLAYARLTGS